MLYNWKLFGVTALVAVALAVPATARAQSDGPPPQDERFDKLEKQIESFKDKLFKELAGMTSYMNSLKDEIKSLRTEMELKAQAANSRIVAVETSLAQLKLDLDRLRADLDAARSANKQISLYPSDQLAELMRQLDLLNQTVRSISLYPQANGQAPVVTTGRGSIVVENRYPETVTLLVNGVEQARIAPYSRIVVRDLPVGPVNYSILSSFGETRRAIVICPGEPLQVNVQ